jgi:hypothetical protein
LVRYGIGECGRLAASVARHLAHHHLTGGAEFGEQLAHRRQGHARLGGDLEVELARPR